MVPGPCASALHSDFRFRRPVPADSRRRRKWDGVAWDGAAETDNSFVKGSRRFEKYTNNSSMSWFLYHTNFVILKTEFFQLPSQCHSFWISLQDYMKYAGPIYLACENVRNDKVFCIAFGLDREGFIFNPKAKGLYANGTELKQTWTILTRFCCDWPVPIHFALLTFAFVGKIWGMFVSASGTGCGILGTGGHMPPVWPVSCL